jgi:hypothetical protein
MKQESTMTRIHHLPAALTLVAALAAALTASNAAMAQSVTGADARVAFEAALQEYRAGHHAGAYGRFAQLADRGHVESARIAGTLYRHGIALHGADWFASPSQLEHWDRLVRADELRFSALLLAGE